MAKVTWLGEGDDGPDETTWATRVFHKGKVVEINDEKLLLRVSGNKFFKVEGFNAAAKHDEPAVHRPPSEQPVPGPVPKAGDPIVPEAFQMKPPVDELPPPPEAGGNVVRKPSVSKERR